VAIFDVAHRRQLVAELEAQAAQPDFWDSPNAARDVIDKTNRHKVVLKPFDELNALLEDAMVMHELAGAEKKGSPEYTAAVSDVDGLLRKAERVFEALEMQQLLNGPMDKCNAFLSLHSGAGGTEACDWAEMLLRMYQRYCERAGFEVEIMDVADGDEAGITSATFAKPSVPISAF